MVAAIQTETDTPQTNIVPTDAVSPLLQTAGAALVAGDTETAAASLWQAVAEAAKAAAQKSGWPYAGETAIRQTIRQLDAECPDRRPLMPMLLTAEALRPPSGSLCHLGQDGLLTYAPEVTKLVIRLLAAAGADYRRAVCARMTAAAARPAQSPPEYLTASEQAFAIGDRLEGAANLWLAVRAAAIYLAQKRALPHDDDEQIREVIRHLEPAKGERNRLSQFSTAETFKYYVQGFVPLKRYQIATPRNSAVDLTHYLLQQAGRGMMP